MYTTFESLANKVKSRTVKELGQELNRDIIEEQKELDRQLTVATADDEINSVTRFRRELNKRRIDALGLKLIQGGKDETL